MIKESERLTRLINQMLDLAKIESGNAEWHMSALDLKAVIEDSLAATQPMFEEKQIQLEVDLPEEVPLVIADPDRLMQVMLNLLSERGQILRPDRQDRSPFACKHEADGLRVDVRDNGPGISACGSAGDLR